MVSLCQSWLRARTRPTLSKQKKRKAESAADGTSNFSRSFKGIGSNAENAGVNLRRTRTHGNSIHRQRLLDFLFFFVWVVNDILSGALIRK